MIEFEVIGMPRPKGSYRSFAYRRKDGRLGTTTINSNPATATWEQRVATEAQRLAQERHTSKGCAVTLRFRMPRPKSLPKRVQLMTRRPDIDKLARTVLDGLTGTILADDSQIVSLTASKRYCQGDELPGCHIVVEEVEA